MEGEDIVMLIFCESFFIMLWMYRILFFKLLYPA